MNKYQEALNTLKTSDIKLFVYKEQENVVEEHQPTIFDFYHSEIFALQELVEKATPKKLLYNGEYVSFCNCPNCKKVVPIHGNYCPRCGQKLDWRVDER